MKRYILAIVCCVMAIMTYAECTTLTGSSVEISRWYDFYMPVVGGEMECWTVELEGEGPYQIRYNIDLDQFVCDDVVYIYEIKADGTLQLLKMFSAVTRSGTIVTYSKNFKVIIVSLFVTSSNQRFRAMPPAKSAGSVLSEQICRHW